MTFPLLLNCSWEEEKKEIKRKGEKEISFLYIVYISRNGIYHLQMVIFAVLIMNVYFIHTSSKLSSYTIRTGDILFQMSESRLEMYFLLSDMGTF